MYQRFVETKPRILDIILNVIVKMPIQLDPQNWYSNNRSLLEREREEKNATRIFFCIVNSIKDRVLDFPREFRSNRKTFPREEH